MTRWEEVEDRLHTMMDVLAYVPTGMIIISYLNRANVVYLDRAGKDPTSFLQIAHTEIAKQFVTQPNGGTPIYSKLDRTFKSTTTPTLHYLFTDGEPSDARVEKVTELVLKRPNPMQNPITFVSCTNDDSATGWLKDIDDKGPMIAEVDDYLDEKHEVLLKHGPALPYSRGFWLISLLIGAINPDDIDGLDDPRPISKHTFDNLMGRNLTEQEYAYYFNNNPNGPKYRSFYSRLLNEKKSTREIVPFGM